MAGRGPAPKSTALVLVENGGKLPRKAQRARAKTEPMATPGVREPPPYLTADQRAVWANVVADAPGGVLCRIDTDTLAHFVVMVDAQNSNCRRFNEAGADPFSKQGKSALAAVRMLAPLIRQWVAEYGFTPAARA